MPVENTPVFPGDFWRPRSTDGLAVMEGGKPSRGTAGFPPPADVAGRAQRKSNRKNENALRRSSRGFCTGPAGLAVKADSFASSSFFSYHRHFVLLPGRRT
jgi:hypothetical protein